MCDVVCAGHVALDITPVFPERSYGINDVFVPGKLFETGDLVISTGGSVSNTGMALQKLGVETALMGRLGSDVLADIVKQVFSDQGARNVLLKSAENDSTSYTCVLALHGMDRIFLHNSAANHNFGYEDIDFNIVSGAKLLHIGYPTCMRRLSDDSGGELRRILEKAKELGVTTSVDTSYPDINAQNITSDWEGVFRNTLPFTDVFTPSLEEAMLMFDRPEYDRLQSMGGVLDHLDLDYLPVLSGRLLAMGAGIVLIKCGHLGMFAACGTIDKLSKMGKASPDDISDWAGKEVFSGIYDIKNIQSTTGAGDTSIGGFLAALLRGESLENAVDMACATGASCCQHISATGGIMDYDRLADIREREWRKLHVNYRGTHFAPDDTGTFLKNI